MIKPIPKNIFLSYLPKDKFFKKNPHNTLHGFLHISRVILYMYVLTQINHVRDYKKYLIAASIHDLRRFTDSREDGHGEKAAKWFKKNYHFFKEVKEQNVKDICYAVETHDKYEDIKSNDKEKDKMSEYLKSADALDRYRLPKIEWFPNPKYIPLNLNKKILEFAKYFTLETEKAVILNKGSPIDILIKKGEDVGLIK